MPLAGAPEVLSGVAQRVVACRVDGVADDLPLGFGRREFGGKGDGFMGGEHEIEPGVLAGVLAPVGAVVGATGFEESVELRVARL